MLERFTARSGAASLRVAGSALHSPYDPEREAARFIETALADETPSTVVLLGEGLGYAARVLEERLPGVRILLVFYSQELAGLSRASSHPRWHPGSPQGVADFFRASLAEMDMEGLRALEWQPSAAAWPEQSRAAHEALRQVLQELNGSLVTTVSAGKLWIRNTVSNFVHLDMPLAGSPCGPERTVLVAASGPSLARALPLLASARKAVELWSLPSSVPFLLAAGLRPDLVVMTDPGHWATIHLRFADPACPVAMPLSAARGLWRLHAPAAYILVQPSFYEDAFLSAAGLAAPRVPPHGTVAASAIDLALQSTAGPVVCAGLDMCAEDVSAHCRPNAFEDYLSPSQSRTSPLLSQLFSRVFSQQVERLAPGGASLRILRSLRTYAGWFSQGSPRDRGRLYRLLPTAVPLPRLETLDGKEFLALAQSRAGAERAVVLSRPPGYPGAHERGQIADGILARWASEVEHGVRRFRAGAGLAVFSDSPLLLPLAWHVDPRVLLDARRKARTAHAAAALEAGERALDACAAFLAALRRRLPDA
jgi:hypothetical protein